MIKYEVYKEKEEEKVKIVYFKLVKMAPNVINLVIVDENGRISDYGNILKIRDGHIYTIPNVSSKFGLDLGEEDRVKID